MKNTHSVSHARPALSIEGPWALEVPILRIAHIPLAVPRVWAQKRDLAAVITHGTGNKV
jgi:hypothetical protein